MSVSVTVNETTRAVAVTVSNERGPIGPAGSDADVTAADVATALASATDEQAADMREELGAANRLPEFRETFARLATGTSFASGTQTPEIGGVAWRCNVPGAGAAPTVEDDATYGRGLISSGANLYYLASDIGTGKPIRNIVFDLTLKPTGNTTGISNGFTISFQPTPLLPSGSLGILTGMIHLVVTNGSIAMGIATTDGAVFENIIADGETIANVPYFRDGLSGLVRGGRYTLAIRFEGDVMTATIAGKTVRWRDSRISEAAVNSFWFETAGPTGMDDLWIVHAVTANDDSEAPAGNGAGLNDWPGALAASAFVKWPAKQRHEINGAVGSFTKGSRPSNVGLAVADQIYSEKGFFTRPWTSSDGEAYAVLGYSSANASNSPSGTDQNWSVIGASKLSNVGDWWEQVFVLSFPNTNSKTFKYKTTGGAIAELTMPAFTDSGIGTLTMRQMRSSTVTNLIQLTLQVVVDSTAGTTKTWIRNYSGSDGDGNKALRIVFTGTASGDAVILGSTSKLFVKNP